jgi:hypothetical protein
MIMNVTSYRTAAGRAAKAACVVCVALASATPAEAQNWTNTEANQNFGDFGNWSGGVSSFTGTNQTWRINLTGTGSAELSTAVGSVQRDLIVGGSTSAEKGALAVTATGSMTVTRDFVVSDGGGEGTLSIDGGSVTVTRNMRVARQGENDGYGIVTIDGGSLSVGQDLFTGQSNRLQNEFTLNSGTVAVTRDLNVAHSNSNQSVVNIAGGSFTVGGDAFFSDGGTSASTSFLNLSGGELDIVGSASFANNGGGATSTVTIQDNATLRAASLRVGFGASSLATVNIEGGLIDVPTGFVTFSQGAGADVTVNMSGGTLNADRMNWGNLAATELAPGASATLNMSSGVINVVRTEGSTNTTSGAFGLQAGNPEIDLTGNALVNTERLLINNGGTLDLGGDSVMNVTGATDGRATLDFAAGLISPALGGGWDTVNGTINFSTRDSVLQVTGTGQDITVPGAFTYTFDDLFTQAIANGKITKSVAGIFDINYDAGSNLTTLSVVPEPSSIALGLGAVALFGLGLRARRQRD